MRLNRPIRLVSGVGLAVTLLGGGVAAASATSSPGVASAAQTTTPTSVQVTNFPATQNVAGTVNIGNLPATQNVSGSVNVANLPATQNVSGNVSVTGSTVGIDPSSNTVRAQQSGTWTVSQQDATATVEAHQFPSAGQVQYFADVDAYKSVHVDLMPSNFLPSGCTVDFWVFDVVNADNVANDNYMVARANGTLTGFGSWQTTLDTTTPRIYVETLDTPAGCASSTGFNVGVYGRVN